MKELIGKEIESLYISQSQTCMTFVTTDGEEITYEVDGDCCSHSWFNDILGAQI